jgi:hypothetical protein
MKIASGTILAALATLVAAGAGQPARAACFESGIGCTDSHYISKSRLAPLSCDALWTVRNTIYDERGYCFRTRRAIETFSNDDCSVSDVKDLPLNRFERTNIDRIVGVERQKGCR